MNSNQPDQQQTILVVDDETEALNVLAEILSDKGYKTLKAETGFQAVHLATEVKPDLVILDLNLPDLTGTEVLERLKRLNSAIQVIILTGYGSQGAVRRAMEGGAFEFLTKPFDQNEFLTVVGEALKADPPPRLIGENCYDE
ncbi:MAG: response regulator [Deltaproteobacteria bacterium]|nr:response regulator [Deltaproteobacteria bacterium]